MISSDDTRALDLLEELMGQLAPPRIDYKIFRLNYARAYYLASTLEDIFKEEEKDNAQRIYVRVRWYRPPGGRTRATAALEAPAAGVHLRLDSNSILVKNADATQLAKIEELIEFYDKPEPVDSQSVRKQKIFKLRYAKAATVADAVKDVYRDLLSPNDKALAGSPPTAAAQRTVYYFDFYGSDDGQSQQKAPRFKGLLSIGVNELSNTLVVSSPVFLMKEITPLVESLDEMAKPAAETVEVLDLGGNVDVKQLQEKLNSITGGSVSAGSSHDRSHGHDGSRDRNSWRRGGGR